MQQHIAPWSSAHPGKNPPTMASHCRQHSIRIALNPVKPQTPPVLTCVCVCGGGCRIVTWLCRPRTPTGTSLLSKGRCHTLGAGKPWPGDMIGMSPSKTLGAKKPRLVVWLRVSHGLSLHFPAQILPKHPTFLFTLELVRNAHML